LKNIEEEIKEPLDIREESKEPHPRQNNRGLEQRVSMISSDESLNSSMIRKRQIELGLLVNDSESSVFSSS
jgi:hypothetical protein